MKSDSLEGIRGWMILPVLGLIVTPIRMAYDLLSVAAGDDGCCISTILVAAPGEFHPLMAPYLVSSIVSSVVLILLAAVTLLFIYKKSSHAPKLAITWFVLLLAYAVSDWQFLQRIPDFTQKEVVEAETAVLKTGIHTLIWVPYFLFSKRVRATFTLPWAPNTSLQARRP